MNHLIKKNPLELHSPDRQVTVMRILGLQTVGGNNDQGSMPRVCMLWNEERVMKRYNVCMWQVPWSDKNTNDHGKKT